MLLKELQEWIAYLKDMRSSESTICWEDDRFMLVLLLKSDARRLTSFLCDVESFLQTVEGAANS